MKSRILPLMIMLCCCAGISASVVIPEITIPENSGLTLVSHDPASRTYTYTKTGDVQATSTRIRLSEFTENLPEDITQLAFTYKIDQPTTGFHFRTYKGGSNQTRNYIYELQRLDASDKWQSMIIDIVPYRKNVMAKFGLAGQYQELDFYQLPQGATLVVRGLRYESGTGTSPFVNLTINPTADNIIEAENYDFGLKGHSGRQYPAQTPLPYKNPVGNTMPIYAWCGPGFDGTRGEAGMKEDYKNLWECGFNLTKGTAWHGVDLASLTVGGAKVNTDQVWDFFEGTGLKMIVNNSEIRYRPELLQQYITSPRFAGVHIVDEPFVPDIPAIRPKMESYFPYATADCFFYGNLIHSAYPNFGDGTNNYNNYVDTYMRSSGMSFLSFDMYPVREKISTGELFLDDQWFDNLERIVAKARYYQVPFWSFIHSVKSNCLSRPTERYPKPTREGMSVEAFTALAYGAQGIQYYLYPHDNNYDYQYEFSCIDAHGNKTDTWYMAQEINREITALDWVFVDCELEMAGHTNAVTPIGARRLTPEMLPEGIASVTSDGSGLLVTSLRKGTYRFVMVVNPDVNNAQTAVITTTRATKRVGTDGKTTPVDKGSNTFPLLTGQYVCLVLDENLPDHTPYYYKEKYTQSSADKRFDTDYRNENDGVDMRQNSAMSNGRYLADMGDRNAIDFTVSDFADAASATITQQQAIANWGASYRYTFDVKEETSLNISIGHTVVWDEYAEAARRNAIKSDTYTIDNDPTANWPLQYLASAIVELDGTELTPSNQPLRPSLDEAIAGDADAYNAMLADNTRWTNARQTNALYFWPKAGGDNTLAPRYNAKPDYTDVRLTPGTHTITVKSLCYPWHFDNILISPNQNNTSAVDDIIATPDEAPAQWYNLQGIRVNPSAAAPGLYLRRQGTKTEKIKL